MGRARRFDYPGAVYHVTTRGNNQRAIYLADADYELFLRLLARAARASGWVVYSYCLMTNHYHLVVGVSNSGLAKGMSLLNGSFARISNESHGRSDHLFGKRYSATLIESDAHLLEACRYVVLNPVRARACATPGDWPWSSYRAAVGEVFPPASLQNEALLRLFGPRPAAARRSFDAFVSEGHAPVPGTGVRRG